MLTSTLSRPAPPTAAAPRALFALLAAMTMAAVMLLGPVPAHAHDTLISSDPADGATLEASPEQITLTYSADVLEVSPVVQISPGGDGEPIVLEPVIDGPIVTAQITEPLTAGTHTAQWRVVSSDGHPIEGSITFTVEGEPGASGAGSGEEGRPRSERPSQKAFCQRAQDQRECASKRKTLTTYTPTTLEVKCTA